METRSDSGAFEHGRLPRRGLRPTVEVDSAVPKAQRGELALQAISDGDRSIIELFLTADVRLTSFDRGEIHEAHGSAAVSERLGQLGELAPNGFVPTGSRVADDAVFFWGGSSNSDRPGWMITLFSRQARFFDVRVYWLG